MARKMNRTVGLSALFLSALAAIIAGVAYAAHHSSDAEVRVGAMRHDDGRVEIAVQQRDADGSWGELQRPDARFLPADVTGEWRSSSPVSLTVIEAMSSDAMADAETPAALYCVVHHGADNDPFWGGFNAIASANAADLGLTNIEIHAEPVVSEQAAAITDCAERGAAAIASSIPDFDGLREALIAARAAGSILFTFNSGADAAGKVGSTIHYALDERAAGELAGNELTAGGVTGTVLCIVHEAVNVGLQERCDGIESAYDGTVERVTLAAGSLANPMAAGAAIADAVGEHEAAGVVVLNAALTEVAIAAVQPLEGDVQVGSIGRPQSMLLLIANGSLLFATDDASQTQASHVILSLKNVDSSPTARAMLALTPGQAPETTTMLVRPVAINQTYLDNLPEGWQAGVCALAQQVAPELAASFCDE